ncbi:MAG: hypothetical protein ACREOB_02920, partial [Thermodesulfobacteriota bacterium]
MTLSPSVLRWFIWITIALGLAGLFAIGFSYLEPVKTKRMLRHTDNWVKRIRADKVQKQGSTNDYESLVLSGDFPRAIEEPTGFEKIPIRLMDMKFEPNSSSSARKVSVSLDGQQRNAITGVVPFNFSYNLHVPNGGYLWFGVNQEGWGSLTGELNFSVEVSNKGGTRSMYDLRLASSHEGWKDGSVDLSPFAGQEVKIRFNASPEDSIASTT